MRELYSTYIEGGNELFEAFFEKHHTALLLIAYRYMRNEDDAADVVADVYNKLIGFSVEERNQFLPENYEEFVFYVRRMVVNKSLDTYKQKANQRRLLTEHFSKNTASLGFDEQEMVEPRLQEIIRELLNPRELEVLTLHIQGYKNAEISQKLDLSYFTVRNLIHLSKKKLKKQYKKYFQ